MRSQANENIQNSFTVEFLGRPLEKSTKYKKKKKKKKEGSKERRKKGKNEI